MTAHLFGVTADDVATTTDDWYTPPWLFTAAGVVFDVDVAAPVDPQRRTCPARDYLTVVEDGLTHAWDGLIWMNPPYSQATPWVHRWVEHCDGLALLPAVPEVRWLGELMAAAEAATLLAVDFGRPDGRRARLRWPLLLAGRGTGASLVPRIAAADRYARGAYLVRPS